MQQVVGRLVADESGGGRRLGLRVGLNTGEVLAGVQGHVSYTVVGDAVNTASRLSDAAGVGAVYAGRESAAASMQAASWRALPPLRLKGKREPVEAYELVGLRAGVPARVGIGDEAPTIGREAELGALVGRFLTVTDSGSPATVLLVGDAGIGKTLLAEECARFAGQVGGTRVLWGHCVPYGLSRDFAPLAEMVRTACGVPDDAPAGEVRERIGRAVARLGHPSRAGLLAPTAAELSDQLCELLGLGSQPAESLHRIVDVGSLHDGATPGRRLEHRDLEGLLALFDAFAAEDPLVLVVDDLHYARESLRDALRTLATRLRGRVLLLGCGRPELFGPDRDGWWQDLPAVEVVPIGPLDDAAAERLLRAYLGGKEIDEATRRVLVDRAQGNPFFLAELLHLLVDQGALRPDGPGGGWRLTRELPAELLPAGVQAVLAARIDSLDPVARALLRDAAVIGTSFPAGALPALDPRITTAQAARALVALVGRGILTEAGDGRNGRYAFTHTLTRDVAYAGLPKVDRARRHAAAARWAVATMRAPAGEIDAVVAVQADRAVRLATEMALPPEDLAWSVAALGFAAAGRLGHESLGRDDHAGAAEHFTRALRLGNAVHGEGPAAPALGSARVAFAEALAGQRRLAEAERQLTGPLAGEPALRAPALVVLGDVRHKLGDDDAARAALVQAFALASDIGLDRVTGAALRQLGLLDYLGGRLRDAEGRFAQALELSRRVHDPRGAGWALQHLAWSATTRGDYALADRSLAEASEVFLSLHDSGGLAWCAGTEALVRLLQGRLAEARDLVAGLLPLADSLGAGWETAACLTIDAIAAAELGDLPTAERGPTAAAARFAELRDTWGLALTAIADGLTARGRGHTRDARQALRRAVATAAGGGHRALELLATVSLGLVHLDRGDVKAAASAADRAEILAEGMGLLDGAMVGLRVLRAEVLRSRGRIEAAAALLELAAATDAPSLLFPRRQALAHWAAVVLQNGDVPRARELIERALRVPAEDLRSRVVALRVLADVREADGDRPAAVTAARQALELAEAAASGGEVPASRKTLTRVGG